MRSEKTVRRLLSYGLAVGLGGGLGVLATRSGKPADEILTPEKVLLEGYARYACLTPPDYEVDAGLLMLCRGANPTDVVEAEKHTGPHAFAQVRVLMNLSAEAAQKSGTKTFPVGAVVVKEKVAHPYPYLPDAPRRLSGVTGMIKRAPGYDPANGDWEYFIQETGAPLEKGKIVTCIGCHQKAPGPDHLFARWLKQDKLPLR
jgi:hypothetical protein